MTNAGRSTTRRRRSPRRIARKPLAGSLAVAALVGGAWYATAATDNGDGGGSTADGPSTSASASTAKAVANRNSFPGKAMYLTSAAGTENVNVRRAPYGKDRLLVSWESLKGAKCAAGTCASTFTGTHLRLIDWNGKARGADKVVTARISGDMAVLKNGTLTWAYAPVTPTSATPLNGASPTTTSLRIARLTP
ncbi:hypothetical protein ACFWOB_14710 [Streptomyces sp. NPDC058420]|uniref:hypothetical protein n=1 Tax=Streptomyces sp. NPDC058420 TaxID=3346489 RepID=UPI003647D17B